MTCFLTSVQAVKLNENLVSALDCLFFCFSCKNDQDADTRFSFNVDDMLQCYSRYIHVLCMTFVCSMVEENNVPNNGINWFDDTKIS